MFYFSNSIRFLDMGVFQEKPIDKPMVDIYMDIFINRACYEKATVIYIIGWQVGAATAERNSQR